MIPPPPPCPDGSRRLAVRCDELGERGAEGTAVVGAGGEEVGLEGERGGVSLLHPGSARVGQGEGATPAVLRVCPTGEEAGVLQGRHEAGEVTRVDTDRVGERRLSDAGIGLDEAGDDVVRKSQRLAAEGPGRGAVGEACGIHEQVAEAVGEAGRRVHLATVDHEAPRTLTELLGTPHYRGMTAHNRFEGYEQPLPAAVLAAGFRHRFVEVPGARLHVVVAENGRPPLLLLPAQMGTWQTYTPVLPALAEHFSVAAVDLRGHGASTWTPGDYSWDSVGGDLVHLLPRFTDRPAVVAGNSSGGVVTLWLASRHPELVSALVVEDAPVFSAEMPRFRDRDRFVYAGLTHLVEAIGDVGNRRLADYFRGQVMPVSETRTKQMPGWLCDRMQRSLDAHARRHPGVPARVGRPWPRRLGDLFTSLDMFDPDFARAFVDGRFYGDVDHAELVAAVTCPTTLLHGDWHRYEAWGLVGALDDDDARRFCDLAPQTRYVRMKGNHVLHHDDPAGYVAEVCRFA